MSPRAASLFLTVLFLSAAMLVFPISPAVGSSGNPTLGVTNTDSTRPTSFTPGAVFVNVTAGSDSAETDGSTPGFFAIDFGTFGGAQLVTFSGAQFKLYLSQDGFAQLSPGDISYAGPTLFSVSDLTTTSGWHAVSETNGTFFIGQTTGGDEVVTGPLPISVSNAYKYIKVFDGSSAAVAVSSQQVNIQPGMSLTPTSGAAGEAVTVLAGGFPVNKLIDLTYSYTFYPWNGVPTTHTGNWSASINTGTGSFSLSAPMLDTKQAYNPNSGLQPASHITISAKYHSTPHSLLATATFDESTRILAGVISYNSAGGAIDFNNSPPGPYGNDTSTAGSNLVQPVDANVLGSLNIAGNQWMASSSVTFWVGSTQVGSSTTNASGYFNATMSVPVLPAGTSVLKVVNNGVTYQFSIFILPTLVLTPSSGPVGTQVTVQAYGFPSNTAWFLYWHEHSLGDATWYQIGHGTVGVLGTFNVTVAFGVPQSYNGAHAVTASSTNVSTSTPNSPGTTEALTTMGVGGSVTSTTTTTTTTVSTTVTQSVTLIQTQSTTVTQVTTQTGTVTQSTTRTQTLTQVVTTTATAVSSPDLSFYYATIGGLVVVSLGLAFWALRSRRV